MIGEEVTESVKRNIRRCIINGRRGKEKTKRWVRTSMI